MYDTVSLYMSVLMIMFVHTMGQWPNSMEINLLLVIKLIHNLQYTIIFKITKQFQIYKIY